MECGKYVQNEEADNKHCDESVCGEDRSISPSPAITAVANPVPTIRSTRT